MRPFLTAVLLTALFSFSCDLGRPPARIQGPGERLAEMWQSGIEAAVEHNDLASISVAVVDQAEIIWLESFGNTNLQTGQSNNPDRLHRLGNVSKIFVSFALHRLENEGKLSLEDTLLQFFPETQGTYLEAITLRQILMHSSGIFAQYWETLETDIFHYRNSLNMALSQDPVFPAGERFSYSDVGYDILGMVIEAVTEKDFASYMDQDILPDLGLSGAGFNPEGKSIIPGHTEGRTFEENLPNLPSDGMVASLNHLSQFLIKLSDIYHGPAVEAWDRADMDSIRGYHNGEIEWPSGVYFGLGSTINAHRFTSSGPVLGEEAYNYGSSAGLFYLPEEDVGIVFMGNDFGIPTGNLSAQILKNLFDTKNMRRIGKYEPESMEAEPLATPMTLAEIGGRYYGEHFVLDITDGDPIAEMTQIDENGEVLRSEVEITDRELGFFFLEGPFGPEVTVLEVRIYGQGEDIRIYNKYDGRDDYFLAAGTRTGAISPNPEWSGVYSLIEGPKENPDWSEDLNKWLRRDDIILEVVGEVIFIYYESEHFTKTIRRPFIALEGGKLRHASFGPYEGGWTWSISEEEGVFTMDVLGEKYQKVEP